MPEVRNEITVLFCRQGISWINFKMQANLKLWNLKFVRNIICVTYNWTCFRTNYFSIFQVTSMWPNKNSLSSPVYTSVSQNTWSREGVTNEVGPFTYWDFNWMEYSSREKSLSFWGEPSSNNTAGNLPGHPRCPDSWRLSHVFCASPGEPRTP